MDTHTALPRKRFPERHEPRASRAQPAPTRRKHPESQRSCAQAAGASAHTPTARRSVRLPRLTPSDDAPEHTHANTHAPEHNQIQPHLSRAARTTRDRRGARASATRAIEALKGDVEA
jgi:hypothetical protein